MSLLLLYNQPAGVVPPDPVEEINSGGWQPAKRVHWGPQKQTATDLFLGVPLEDSKAVGSQVAQPEPVEKAVPAIEIGVKPGPVPSLQDIRRSVQAGIRDAQVQALLELGKQLTAQQAALEAMQLDDDEALLALLLA